MEGNNLIIYKNSDGNVIVDAIRMKHYGYLKKGCLGYLK